MIERDYKTVFNEQVIAPKLANMPERWAKRIIRQFTQTESTAGRVKANAQLEKSINSIQGFKVGIASDDYDLNQFAKARADECFRAASRYVDADEALAAMLEIAQRYEIPEPAGRNVTKTGQRLRLLSPDWWRRNLRKVTARNVEAAAIKLGMVSRVAGLYASDEAVKRRRGQRKRNAQILASIIATNDEGQEYSLAELAELGVSNPEIRRMELMTRIAGFDALAIKMQHAAEFYTLTAPSKYHARHHITGKENPGYEGYTPAETQAYLCKVWAQIRAKLHRDGIMIYGFRVAEPHHDGTPHWHMIIFCEPAHTQYIREVMKAYALKEDGDEKGADIHRFKAEAIDRKRGSAVGYIAKYISKNIDGKNAFGESVGEDYEAIKGKDDAITTARRVDAWAATWGIRQFQQIGGQSVTVWRELRRADVSTIQNEDLKAVAAAADGGAWDRYTELNGGVTGEKSRYVTLEKLPAVDDVTGEIRMNKYTELAAPLTVGFGGFSEVIKTRIYEWVFKRNKDKPLVNMDRVLKRDGVAVAPRSSVNNCTEEKKFPSARADLESEPAYCLVNFARENDFLKGEALEKWKQQQTQEKKTPVPQTRPVWPGCLKVLSSFTLKPKQCKAPE